MDGAALQDRLSRGMGVAARATGLPHDLFRACGAEGPLRAEHRVLRLDAAFDGGDPGYRRPRGYERGLRGLFDMDCTRVGDYLAGPRGVLFIVALPMLARPLCMLANATVSVLRAVGAQAVGLNEYGGVQESRLRTVLAEWPAEVLEQHGSGRGSLPNEGGLSGWSVILPTTPDVIEASDLVQDGAGRRFLVLTAEHSELGWRLLVRQVGV